MEKLDDEIEAQKLKEVHTSQEAQAQFIKQANENVINFASKLRQEKAIASVKLQIKASNAMQTFNKLQDLRHLILLDLRSPEEFARSHIRKAINCTVDEVKQRIASALLTLNHLSRPGSKADPVGILTGVDGDVLDGRIFASQFKEDDVRRVLIVLPDTDKALMKQMEDQLNAELPVLAEGIIQHGKDRLSKAFYLKEYAEFERKYPLLCVPAPLESELQGALSLSRFPSEVRKDSVFIGNLTNVLAKDYKQLKMLNIKTVIHMTPNKFEDLEKHFDCIHYEARHFDKDLETLLEFDEAFIELQQIIENQKSLPDAGAVLIMCVNGMLASALAIRLMMETNKAFNKELAVAYVMNLRYEVKDMPSWLYAMI